MGHRSERFAGAARGTPADYRECLKRSHSTKARLENRKFCSARLRRGTLVPMGQAVAFAKPEGFVRSRGGRALGSAVDVTFVAIAGAALVLAVPATAPAAVTFGQLDDFQDGTAMGWREGQF